METILTSIITVHEWSVIDITNLIRHNQIRRKFLATGDLDLPPLPNMRGIQVIANQTVVQAQAQAKTNIAKAGGASQAIKIITSQLRQDPQYLQW